jgi:hypothetical protein
MGSQVVALWPIRAIISSTRGTGFISCRWSGCEAPLSVRRGFSSPEMVLVPVPEVAPIHQCQNWRRSRAAGMVTEQIGDQLRRRFLFSLFSSICRSVSQIVLPLGHPICDAPPGRANCEPPAAGSAASNSTCPGCGW